jgi:hypothetical protein
MCFHISDKALTVTARHRSDHACSASEPARRASLLRRTRTMLRVTTGERYATRQVVSGSGGVPAASHTVPPVNKSVNNVSRGKPRLAPIRHRCVETVRPPCETVRPLGCFHGNRPTTFTVATSILASQLRGWRTLSDHFRIRNAFCLLVLPWKHLKQVVKPVGGAAGEKVHHHLLQQQADSVLWFAVPRPHWRQS